MQTEREIVYFSMEIGLDAAMPTYSGGLGVLAGDTLRAAADLGVPMIGVTLLYRHGYFRQHLDADGNQSESACSWNPEDTLTPMEPIASIVLAGRRVHIRSWRFLIQGESARAIPVYFLDTDLADNHADDRPLSGTLYGGDRRYRDLFVPDVTVGAPPDYFMKEGQNWGFHPLDPKRLNDGGTEYWTTCLKHHLRVARLLRIDHMMGLHRLYWIPKGVPATQGHYVAYPHDAFYKILCRESARHRALMIGEDLGSVGPEVRPMMQRYGVSRTYVVQYEHAPEDPGPFTDIPEQALVTLNTHDMPTFAAWWGNRPNLENALLARLFALATSKAHTLLISLEDLWFETYSHNDPGRKNGNWQHKAQKTLEELEQDSRICAILQSIHHVRQSLENLE